MLICSDLKKLEKFEVEKPIDFDFNKTNYNLKNFMNYKSVLEIWLKIRNRVEQFSGVQRHFIARFLFSVLILVFFVTACSTERDESNWVEGDTLSISQYLEKNHEEFSMFYRLLNAGKMLNTLYAYNPYGEDYTLFLPTNSAIEKYLLQNPKYGNFEELLKDSGLCKILTRYHTINKKLHTDEFPDGALFDKTLTGERLVTTFYTIENKQAVRVNNSSSVIKANLKMTNGYIHVVSEVLQPVKVSGYDWLQQQKDYSILAQAVKLSGLKSKMWWTKYTILAEHDSIYRKKGINSVDDLVKRIATPGIPVSNKASAFYLYTAYHFIGGEYYLNDLKWGSEDYTTLATKPLMIDLGMEVKINQGVEVYDYKVSATGDITSINYIRPIPEYSNILTLTGPVHSISNLLFYEPFPK